MSTKKKGFTAPLLVRPKPTELLVYGSEIAETSVQIEENEPDLNRIENTPFIQKDNTIEPKKLSLPLLSTINKNIATIPPESKLLSTNELSNSPTLCFNPEPQTALECDYGRFNTVNDITSTMDCYMVENQKNPPVPHCEQPRYNIPPNYMSSLTSNRVIPNISPSSKLHMIDNLSNSPTLSWNPMPQISLESDARYNIATWHLCTPPMDSSIIETSKSLPLPESSIGENFYTSPHSKLENISPSHNNSSLDKLKKLTNSGSISIEFPQTKYNNKLPDSLDNEEYLVEQNIDPLSPNSPTDLTRYFSNSNEVSPTILKFKQTEYNNLQNSQYNKEYLVEQNSYPLSIHNSPADSTRYFSKSNEESPRMLIINTSQLIKTPPDASDTKQKKLFNSNSYHQNENRIQNLQELPIIHCPAHSTTSPEGKNPKLGYKRIAQSQLQESSEIYHQTHFSPANKFKPAESSNNSEFGISPDCRHKKTIQNLQELIIRSPAHSTSSAEKTPRLSHKNKTKMKQKIFKTSKMTGSNSLESSTTTPVKKLSGKHSKSMGSPHLSQTLQEVNNHINLSIGDVTKKRNLRKSANKTSKKNMSWGSHIVKNSQETERSSQDSSRIDYQLASKCAVRIERLPLTYDSANLPSGSNGCEKNIWGSHIVKNSQETVRSSQDSSRIDYQLASKCAVRLERLPLTYDSVNLSSDSNDREDDKEEIKLTRKRRSSTINSTSLPRTNFQNNILTQVIKPKRPPKNFSQRQRLKYIRENRSINIWAQCNKQTCRKWRLLKGAKDPSVVEKWDCSMNTDKEYNSCSKPQVSSFCMKELMDAKFTAGSLVIAKMPGYPWWPAMVDDDPEFAQYFWFNSNNFNKITDFHVVFFDMEEQKGKKDFSRLWLKADKVLPFRFHEDLKYQYKGGPYKKRLNGSFALAKTALKLNLLERLEKFSFISRYSGAIYSYKYNIQNFVREHNLPTYIDTDDESDNTQENSQTKAPERKRNNPDDKPAIEQPPLKIFKNVEDIEDLIENNENSTTHEEYLIIKSSPENTDDNDSIAGEE